MKAVKAIAAKTAKGANVRLIMKSIWRRCRQEGHDGHRGKAAKAADDAPARNVMRAKAAAIKAMSNFGG